MSEVILGQRYDNTYEQSVKLEWSEHFAQLNSKWLYFIEHVP